MEKNRSDRVLGLAMLVCVLCATAWMVLFRYTPGQYSILDEVLGKGSRTKPQAVLAVLALPEVERWMARIEKESGGRARGAVVEDNATVRVVDGKSYWQLSFVRNSADAIERIDSFLVAVEGGGILVRDGEGAAPLTLEQWRLQKQPLLRALPGR